MTDQPLPPGDPFAVSSYQVQVPPPYRPDDSSPDHHDSGTPPPSTGTRVKRATGPVAGAGALLAKFGAVLFKLKALVVVGSMAVSVAAYATLWGWKFALGFVLLILVHEMGHVVVLRARGIKSGWPVFLPFLGAFVSMKSMPRSVYEEAESALAGPVAGTLASLAVAWVAHADGSDLLRSLAFTGMLLNLFNLLPALPLDGGRVAGALHPAIWVVGLAAVVGLEIYRPSPVLLIIIVLGGFELWQRFRGRNSGPSKIYLSLTRQQRLRVAAGYVGLIVVLVVAAHATYIPRTLN